MLRTQQPFVARFGVAFLLFVTAICHVLLIMYSLEVNISGLFDDVSQSDHQTLQALYGNNSLCVEVDSVVGAEGPSYSCVVVFNVYEGDELGQVCGCVGVLRQLQSLFFVCALQVLWLYKKLFNFPDELVSYIAPILEDKVK